MLSPTANPQESLLVLSDVHLGQDLNSHRQPPGFGQRPRLVDDDLVRLLEHYRKVKPAGERWRLVIAGDFIDFIGITVLPEGEHDLNTEPSEEELEHGLGNAADHARAKLRLVAHRHRNIFAALAAFVLDGHALTLVHGNHDVEFHWDGVKDEFRAILASLAQTDDGALDNAAFAARIEFNPWFFYADGLAYIEHGHQYDPFCATDRQMAPMSASDPRRIARGFCDVLLRYVVRPTWGMREYGHEHSGLLDYLSFGARLGVRGLFRLGLNFALAIVELFRVRRAALSDAAKLLRAEHERRMGVLAEATRIGIDRLRALAALQVAPVTHSIGGILASVLLDRLALALGAMIALIVVAIIGFNHGLFWLAGLCVVGAWVLGHRHLSRKRQLDADEAMIDRAGRLVKLFPAAFVVMGHTHTPLELPVAEGAATYINVGSWSEVEQSESDPSSYRAARTHLVIHRAESGTPVMEFLAWSADGPRKFKDELAPAPPPPCERRAK